MASESARLYVKSIDARLAADGRSPGAPGWPPCRCWPVGARTSACAGRLNIAAGPPPG